MRTHSRFTRRVMLANAIEAQGRRCALCGWLFPPEGDLALDQDKPSLDRVWPGAKGGSYVPGNVLAMHKRCNSAKADREPTGCELVWLEAVKARLGASLHDVPETESATLGDIWPK